MDAASLDVDGGDTQGALGRDQTVFVQGIDGAAAGILDLNPGWCVRGHQCDSGRSHGQGYAEEEKAPVQRSHEAFVLPFRGTGGKGEH